ncbi:MAG: FmdB family zinc ribbon protein [bacterium]
MPVYEYLCNQCETKFEELLREGEPLVAHCPKCGAEEVSRLLSLFAATSSGSTKSAGAPSDFSSAGAHACGCGSCSCGSH